MPAHPFLTSRRAPSTVRSTAARSGGRQPPRAVARMALMVLLLALAACGRGVDVPDFRGTWSASAAPIRVDVQNLNYADVTVHASRDGSWRRIGQVTGNSAQTLEVPEGIGSPGGQLRFRVHAIGSPDATDFVTDVIMANRGDVVELRIAPVLRMSSWSVR